VTHNWIMVEAQKRVAHGETAPRLARDPVNPPMINNWVEAIGDHNPIYADSELARSLHGGPVAPTAMAQVWTMYGLDPARPPGDPLHGTMQMLDEAGFTSVLGTNCDQTYARYLLLGEQVAITSRLESVVGPKQTGVGEGYFVTTENTWWVGDEAVATMTFRVLKFKPKPAGSTVDPTRTVRPVRNRDTDFFWEGTAAGELRIQKCNACGLLRHPPGPLCPSCHTSDRGYVVASGRGRVYSWLVHHAPQVPGKQLPLRLALVELEEGVRMVGEVRNDVAIGDEVEVVFQRIDDELTLAQWQLPAEDQGFETVAAQPPQPTGQSSEVEEGALAPVSKQETIPTWELPITPTLVISTALATRDFQDVHHDRDLAVERGSKDIFLNILSTTGLVQRYVSDWAGPEARITACALKLEAPAYPGDTLSFTGTVVSDEDGRVVVNVVGAVSLGSHVNATVTFVKAGADS
jgi:uncharacterized OB-fold protein/acyl dehydratase